MLLGSVCVGGGTPMSRFVFIRAYLPDGLLTLAGGYHHESSSLPQDASPTCTVSLVMNTIALPLAALLVLRRSKGHAAELTRQPQTRPLISDLVPS